MNERDERVRRLIIAKQEGDTDYLIKSALEEAEPSTRTIAIRYLVKLNAIDAIPSLIRLLNVQNESVRIAAVKSLGQLKAADALQELERILDTDADGAARAWALISISQLDNAIALEMARKYCGDPDWKLRSQVMVTIRKYGTRKDAACLDRIIQREENWYMRTCYRLSKWRYLMSHRA
jgi:HEAT repeat protein